MIGKWPYLGAVLVRGIVLPLSLFAWVAIIAMAVTQVPNEAKTRHFDVLANIILAGHH